MFYGKGGPLRGCEGSFVHLDFFLHGGQTEGGNRSGPSARGGGGGGLVNAGEEVQFFCTDVTLFAHSRQVKTFSSENLSLGSLRQEYTVLGRLPLFPGTEQVGGQ